MKTRAQKTWFTSALAFALFVTIAFQSFSTCVEAQYYTRYTLKVTVSEPGAGTVSPSYGAYGYGETVKVTVQTNSGFLFDGWYLNGEYQGKLSTVYVTVYKDSDLTAVFSKRQAKLTITVNPQVGGTTGPLPQVWNYDYGIPVPVKAYPNEGYVFDGWYLDGLYKGLDVNIEVLMTKDHQLDAYFATPETVQPKPNDTRTPTKLVFSCKSSTSFSRFYAQIEGYLQGGGVNLPNALIFILYSVTGGKTWEPLTSVNTNDKGIFSVTWMPSVTGNYMMKAVWDGDANYAEATTVVDFAMTAFQETLFSISSNSTLSQLSFDSNRSELSFGVSGPSGTVGHVDLYVPKSIIADISRLKVYLDNIELASTYEDWGDSWVVLFSYDHSDHMVTVNLAGKSGADNPLEGFLILELAITVVVIIAVVLFFVRRTKKSKSA